MPQSNPTVVVSGLGLVCSLGTAKPQITEALRQGTRGIRPWPGGATAVAGTLEGFHLEDPNPARWQWPAEFPLPSALVRPMPPQGVYAAAAVQMALADAAVPMDSSILTDGRTGLFCASVGSPQMLHHHLSSLAASDWKRAHPHGIVSGISGSLNFHLAAWLGIRGASCNFVSACSSGSHALGYAADEIRLGRQDRVLVVAAEELSLATVAPFNGMGALSRQTAPELASRPFAAGRDGFVPTGGAAAILLESLDSAEARGLSPKVALAGWGQACDGFHIAQPHPEGRGLVAAMRLALADAGVAAEQVDHINAHATSTMVGDAAEAYAIRQVFSHPTTQPWVSATKALTGHGLSMAGCLEAAFCVLCLEDGFLPGNPHLRLPNAVDAACHGLRLPAASLDGSPQIALNNSSAFGGASVSHVFRKLY